MLRIGRLKTNISSGKRWRTKETGSMLIESELPSSFLVHFEQFKDIQEVQSILHCQTLYCYQKVFPRIILTSETEQEFRSTAQADKLYSSPL